MKVYVSMTTIPSRIRTLKTTILSILNQSARVDKIFLNIPVHYERFPGVTIDELLLNNLENQFEGVLQINRVDEDYGPGTKLLGVPAEVYNDDGFLVLVDDDMEYKRDGIEQLIMSIDNEGLYSNYVYDANGVTIAQGADMMAMHLHTIKRVRQFYECIKSCKSLRMNDDLWISYYFYKSGYPIKRAHRDDLVYNIITEVDALSQLQGEDNRWIMLKTGTDFLKQLDSQNKFEFLNNHE